jgi:hypothetical protein
MEKKDELLVDLAQVSDLLDKLKIKPKFKTVILEVDTDEYKKMFSTIQNKFGMNMELPKDTFNVKVGDTDFIFNKNSV